MKKSRNVKINPGIQELPERHATRLFPRGSVSYGAVSDLLPRGLARFDIHDPMTFEGPKPCLQIFRMLCSCSVILLLASAFRDVNVPKAAAAT